MKNKILQSCSLLVLTFFLAVVSAQAQASGAYQAEIPFDFTIGNQNYEAGDYIISLKDSTDPATILTVRNKKGRELQANAVMKNGSTSEDDNTKLVFKRYGNKYVLSKIAAPDFGFNAPKSKVVIRLSKKQKKRAETVSVILKKPEKNVE